MLRTKNFLLFPLMLFGTLLFAQNRTITGKILSTRDATPVPGATITVKGTTKASSSLSDGSFSIEAPNSRVTLVLSSIGFANKEVVVNSGENTVTLNLSEDTRQLSEVVVTALGITRQAKTLVYATQTIKTSEITEARDAKLKLIDVSHHSIFAKNPGNQAHLK